MFESIRQGFETAWDGIKLDFYIKKLKRIKEKDTEAWNIEKKVELEESFREEINKFQRITDKYGEEHTYTAKKKELPPPIDFIGMMDLLIKFRSPAEFKKLLKYIQEKSDKEILDILKKTQKTNKAAKKLEVFYEERHSSIIKNEKLATEFSEIVLKKDNNIDRINKIFRELKPKISKEMIERTYSGKIYGCEKILSKVMMINALGLNIKDVDINECYCPNVLTYLLKNSPELTCKLNSQDKKGNTPLFNANYIRLTTNNTIIKETIEILKKNGAYKNHNKNNETAEMVYQQEQEERANNSFYSSWWPY